MSKVEWLYSEKSGFFFPLNAIPMPTGKVFDLVSYADVYCLAHKYELDDLKKESFNAFFAAVKKSVFYRENIRGAFEGIKFAKDGFSKAYLEAVAVLCQVFPVKDDDLQSAVGSFTNSMIDNLIYKYSIAELKNKGTDEPTVNLAKQWNEVAQMNKHRLARSPTHLIKVLESDEFPHRLRLKFTDCLGLEATESLKSPPKPRSPEERVSLFLDLLRTNGEDWYYYWNEEGGLCFDIHPMTPFNFQGILDPDSKREFNDFMEGIYAKNPEWGQWRRTDRRRPDC